MDLKATPMVSVIMPLYNAESYVAEAIQSILDQTFGDFELIVVDDASTDGSLGVVQGFAKNDPRITMLANEKNIGVSASKNRGMRQAKGKYVAIMDADDVSFPDRLKIEYEYLETHPEIYLVGGSFEYISKEGEVINVHKVNFDAKKTRTMLEKGYVIRHSSTMFRNTREFFFEDKLRVAGDKFFYMKLSAAKMPMVVLPEILVRYRIQENALSTKYLQLQRSLMVRKQAMSEIFDEIAHESGQERDAPERNMRLRELMAAYGEKIPNRAYILKVVKNQDGLMIGSLYYFASFFPKRFITKLARIFRPWEL